MAIFKPDTKQRNDCLGELSVEINGTINAGSFSNELLWKHNSSQMKLVYDNTAVLTTANSLYNPRSDYCTDLYMEDLSIPHNFKIFQIDDILDRFIYLFAFKRIKTKSNKFNKFFYIECENNLYIKNILTLDMINDILLLKQNFRKIIIEKKEQSFRIRINDWIVNKSLILKYMDLGTSILGGFKVK